MIFGSHKPGIRCSHTHEGQRKDGSAATVDAKDHFVGGNTRKSGDGFKDPQLDRMSRDPSTTPSEAPANLVWTSMPACLPEQLL